MKTKSYYENQCERYGEICEVTIEDYRTLNPSGNFSQTPYGIYETHADGHVEQIAVKTVSFE